VVALFSVGAHAEPRRAAAGCALVILTFWVGALQHNARHPGTRGPSDFVYNRRSGCVAAGRGAPGERGRRPAERRARLEPEQQARLRRRWRPTRIARELHDVIAHSVSVMVIRSHAAEQRRQIPSAPRSAGGDARHRPVDHHRAAPRKPASCVPTDRSCPWRCSPGWQPRPALAEMEQAHRRSSPGRGPASTAAARVDLVASSCKRRATNTLRHAARRTPTLVRYHSTP
jgi:hypothetical protein